MTRSPKLIDKPYFVTDENVNRDWMFRGACRGHDPEMWFPQREHDRAARIRTKRATQIAQQMCQNCPVQAACLHHAIITDTRYGIWGGATEDDRARLTGKRAFG